MDISDINRLTESQLRTLARGLVLADAEPRGYDPYNSADYRSRVELPPDDFRRDVNGEPIRVLLRQAD